MKRLLLLMLAFVFLTWFYSEEVKAPSIQKNAKEVEIIPFAPRMYDYSHSGKVTGKVGQNIRFGVKYSGYPMPTCEVYKDGIQIVNSLIYRIRHTGAFGAGEVVVEIEEVELEDSGKYTIVLTNPLGSVSVTYVVEITE